MIDSGRVAGDGLVRQPLAVVRETGKRLSSEQARSEHLPELKGVTQADCLAIDIEDVEKRPELSAKNSRTIAQEIELALQKFLDDQERFSAQAWQVLVKVKIDLQTGIGWIDLDAVCLPKRIAEFTEKFGKKFYRSKKKAAS